MNLKIKNDEENISPLNNEEIKSVLKIQSEAVFQDKNLSNNSNFVKKSLIDIALNFEESQKENTSLQSKSELENKIENSETFIEEGENHIEDTNSLNKNIDNNIEKNNSNTEVENKKSDENYANESTEKLNQEEIKESNSEVVNDIKSEGNENDKLEPETMTESDPNFKDNNTIDDTQQALDSVRDAVSKSIKSSEEKNINDSSSQNEQHETNEAEKLILQDLDSFKKIFSELSNLTEKAIYDIFEKKIIDIANDLAGYQIDEMPEKYEKKIKSFLKNINCFEEKITIEVNEKDYEALSKIDDFDVKKEKSTFLPNKDLSRGDIILNCDGMYYSEKSVKI